MTGHSGSVLDVELDVLLVLVDTLLLELVEVLGVLLLVISTTRTRTMTRIIARQPGLLTPVLTQSCVQRSEGERVGKG